MSKCCWAVVGVVLALSICAPVGGAPQVGERGEGVPALDLLVISGPSQHPPGTHETLAGARVVEFLVKNAVGVRPLRAKVVTEWPSNRAVLEGVRSIVFIGDLFPGETLQNPETIKADLEQILARGCGMVCLHYATGLREQHVAEDGDHPLLRWIGGYFASRCPHHSSVARVTQATLVPETAGHPVSRGWKAFTFEDEPYWNNYFGKTGLASNVTPIVTTMLPLEDPKKEIVGWAIERADGGRGLGLVVPHFFRNWQIDDLRTLVLNGIFWTAKEEIPPQGIQSVLPDLSEFEPDSVEPQPRRQPAAGR